VTAINKAIVIATAAAALAFSEIHENKRRKSIPYPPDPLAISRLARQYPKSGDAAININPYSSSRESVSLATGQPCRVSPAQVEPAWLAPDPPRFNWA
jgi:hypothetical protein